MDMVEPNCSLSWTFERSHIYLERSHIYAVSQVHKAFEYLEKSRGADQPDVRYEVRVRRPDGATTGRGIYLREPLDTLHRLTFMADVRPTFHEVSAQPNPDTVHSVQRAS
jgi:hypothetical protein